MREEEDEIMVEIPVTVLRKLVQGYRILGFEINELEELIDENIFEGDEEQ